MTGRVAAPDGRRDLICFSRADWYDHPWMNRQRVTVRLTRWYRILYVTGPFYVVDLLRDVWRHRLPRGGMQQVADNLARYAPPKYLPLNHRFALVERVLHRVRLAHLHTVCRRLKIRQPILMLWDPEFRDVIGGFNELLVCYFVDDQYSLFGGTPAEAAEEEDRLVASTADVVLCTAEALCEDKRRFNENVHLVPNGVDYELFAAAVGSAASIPSDLRQIPRPIMGFIGSLNDKVDYRLLKTVARENPGWSIVLIGLDNTWAPSERQALRELLMCANVRWLGFRGLAELPAYLKGMDVCTIPNKLNEYTRYVYPIKLHEYLAAGKPVIGTDMPALRPFQDVVQIARSAADWATKMSAALEMTGNGWVGRRQAVARQNTWEIRAAKIHDALEAALRRSARSREGAGKASRESTRDHGSRQSPSRA
jgi:glycosyltransferase involved in cell wall biosynthesis